MCQSFGGKISQIVLFYAHSGTCSKFETNDGIKMAQYPRRVERRSPRKLRYTNEFDYSVHPHRGPNQEFIVIYSANSFTCLARVL